GWSVLADRNADMSSGKFHIRVADRRHADEVESTRKKACEGASERDLAAGRQPHTHAGHVLLGNIAFKEFVRRRSEELVRMRRVLHVTIERNHSRIYFCERLKSITERLAGCHLFFAKPIRRLRSRANRRGHLSVSPLFRQIWRPAITRSG